LQAQAAPFKPVYHFNQRVEGLARTAEGLWQVTTSIGTVIECKAVIVAAGVGAFGPNRPPLDNLEQYEGKSVFYYVTRREDFRNKRVVIAGGGDSAVDWAISLAEVASRVMVVHRRAKFRAAPESEARLKALATAGKIELVVPYQLAGLSGADGRLDAVMVSTLDGQTKALQADALLPFFGLAMNLGPITQWGLNLERNLVAVDAATCSTNLPGVYAIGDIASYAGKLKLILCGFSEAAMAAHAIYPLVHPDQALHFEYSTTSGVPQAS
jgi:thioredoxin reductase (NADPH)